MKTLQLTILLLICGSLNSCRSKVHEVPTSKDFTSAGCMEIDHHQITDHQWQAIYSAANEVCEIIHSPEFRAQLSSRHWLASCERVNGKPDSITGADMYQLLTRQQLRFSIYARKLHDAEAETDNDETNPDNNTITIDPAIIQGWYSPVDTVRSQLINVLAHEYVHLISDRFLDYDDDAPAGCDDDIFISYATGNIVEQLWLQKHRK